MLVNYLKKNNEKLFENMNTTLEIERLQNYIPLFDHFFALKPHNYNSINLNHPWYINDIKEEIVSYETTDDEGEEEVEEKVSLKSAWICEIMNSAKDEKHDVPVFFKMAPLLDPCKYLVGKYDIHDSLFNLPIFGNNDHVHNKIRDSNNASYVDGFFSFLSSQLIQSHHFIHGVAFYGSYLGIKRNFKFNIIDDLECYHESEFFIKNKNILFNCEDYSSFFNTPISTEAEKTITENEGDLLVFEELDPIVDSAVEEGVIEDLTEYQYIKREGEVPLPLHALKKSSCKSSSDCSSRCSVSTEGGEGEGEGKGSSLESVKELVDVSDEEGELDYSTMSDEPEVIVSIQRFPVHVIAMECCENTMEYLIMHEEMSEHEWISMLTQIVFILLVYQTAFHFTHNDLHSHNVMYIPTTQKYIYYTFKGIHYRVPTYGRIFKIIDFGRSIYRVRNKVFFSDSYKLDEDAYSQYNTEPYFNESKPRVEPNFSFDLCRLGCSLFDNVIENMSALKNTSSMKSYTRIIAEWCQDDSGINVLYKSNGYERYPDFKLYKMIARIVHRHTPENQLQRPELKAFIFTKSLANKVVINIDKM